MNWNSKSQNERQDKQKDSLLITINDISDDNWIQKLIGANIIVILLFPGAVFFMPSGEVKIASAPAVIYTVCIEDSLLSFSVVGSTKWTSTIQINLIHDQNTMDGPRFFFF